MLLQILRDLEGNCRYRKNNNDGDVVGVTSYVFSLCVCTLVVQARAAYALLSA